jgi:hypothetical protein
LNAPTTNRYNSALEVAPKTKVAPPSAALTRPVLTMDSSTGGSVGCMLKRPLDRSLDGGASGAFVVDVSFIFLVAA